MITKGENPLKRFEDRPIEPLAAAYMELNHLKQLFRQGWLRRGIPQELCESVAEHVFGMAMLSWWIIDAAFPELDREKVLRMVLAHELGEIYTGDITPGDGMLPAEKHRLEREGLLRVVEKLPDSQQIIQLWEEFEEGRTPEARFARQLDRLEMAFQAAVYEGQGLGDLSEFFLTTSAALEDQRLRDVFESLIQLRKR